MIRQCALDETYREIGGIGGFVDRDGCDEDGADAVTAKLQEPVRSELQRLLAAPALPVEQDPTATEPARCRRSPSTQT